MSEQADSGPTSLELVVKIVAAYVGNHTLAPAELSGVIASVHTALSGRGTALPLTEPEALKPAVPIRKSVTPDYLVCLEDGKKLKMLKRHLMTAYGMTPAEYRAKWKLGDDYPMVAPNYAAQRSMLAKSIGLGRRAAVAPEPTPAPKPTRRRDPAKKPAP
ncbi:MAG TPA: MucR family transcriptional regulator [Stellaceae bacterium]|nr:MucR family transcriptional regulator [Stellaceae bacterium]